MNRIFSRTLTVYALLLCAAAPLSARAQGEDLPQPAGSWLENRAYTQENLYDIPPPEDARHRDAVQTDNDGAPRTNAFKPKALREQALAGVEPDSSQYTPPPSALEDMYSARAQETLEQFGYDLFAANAAKEQQNLHQPPMGAVQDDFILGTGDELQITFTGQRTDQQNYKINSEGLLIVKDLPPLPAAGRSIGEIREEIDAALASLHNTRAYISLTSVRQVGILVVGHVQKPGRQNLTVFHTALDALNAAGGIKKTGTLRKIRLVREGRTQIIDLYDLMLRGASLADTRLRDGDRIIVQPIGPTVAVAGDVKRPGIFELREGAYKAPKDSETLSLEDMLVLAGGILAPGQNRFIRLDLDEAGRENASEIEDEKKKLFSDGAVLSVQKTQESRAGMVELTGHTRRPGLHDLNRNRTLSALLDTPDIFGPDIYPLIGILVRWDPETLSTQYIDFSVRAVSERKADLDLHEKDTVLLLGKTEIQKILQEDSSKPEKIEKIGYSQDTLPDAAEKPALDDSIRKYLKNASVNLTGPAMNPGLYPLSKGVTLDHLLAVAGGLTRDADTANLEITAATTAGQPGDAPARTTYDLSQTPPENIILRPGDSIRIAALTRTAEQRTVTVSGEVRHPGPYDILPGDRVSDLLQRAGGLSQQAYPEGAIFSRESQRKAERLRFRTSAQDMKRALARAVQNDKNAPDAAQIEMVRELAHDLENVTPLGRITVETDPEILAIKPELDMLLEPGDRLHIPKRPLTVRVDGEVLSPASLQFRKDKDPQDYIREAGGFTYHADKDRAFVIFPDGSAQPLKVSLWRHSADLIPPGSTIIVPRDPKPFDFIESAKDISQILSNLAITSIFIDDIRD